MAWDLEETSFAPVFSLVLFLFPIFNIAIISLVLLAIISEIPDINTPLTGSSLRSRFLSSTVNKSIIFSL